VITRPLNLSGHLRGLPTRLDALFYVNVALLAVFFSLFGSRFVLAPGLGVDFVVPTIAGAGNGARTTTHQITVRRSGQILADDGLVTLKQLDEWLNRERAKTRAPSLLVLASVGVPSDEVADIVSVARKAGFLVVWGALEPKGVELDGRK
jgi:biopolymer transport protein ExbD